MSNWVRIAKKWTHDKISVLINRNSPTEICHLFSVPPPDGIVRKSTVFSALDYLTTTAIVSTETRVSWKPNAPYGSQLFNWTVGWLRILAWNRSRRYPVEIMLIHYLHSEKPKICILSNQILQVLESVLRPYLVSYHSLDGKKCSVDQINLRPLDEKSHLKKNDYEYEWGGPRWQKRLNNNPFCSFCMKLAVPKDYSED